MKVYIAGPYSSDPIGNTSEAIRTANEVRDIGHYPFVPHLSLQWDSQHPRDYEDWMKFDFEWLKQCDAVLRFPGHSPGADREVEFATSREISVLKYPEDIDLLKHIRHAEICADEERHMSQFPN